MSNYGRKLTEKPSASTMAVSDKILVKVGDLLRWITATDIGTVLSTVGTFQNLAVRTETGASFTATTANRILICDTTSNAITANLPPAADMYDSTAGSSIMYYILNHTGTNNVTIDPDGAETVNGASTLVVASGGKLVFSDGSNLFAI